MEDLEFDEESLEIEKRICEDYELHGIGLVGAGERCVICGKVKESYLEPFYCNDCRKEGNYEG